MAPVTLRWCGAAHYQLACAGQRLLLDPLYSRLPGDTPHLTETRDALDRVDTILLTHAHLDHSQDVPYLAARHDPALFAPRAWLQGLRPTAAPGRRHALESVKGQTFEAGPIAVTPYQIGAEQIGYWFLRSLTVRPLRHAAPKAVGPGLRFLRHHLHGSCFCFHLRFPGDTTLLYFGNLTSDVSELGGVERVDILALPYCPANDDWIRDTRYLIQRFSPAVTLVHHYDNFMHPFTMSRYIDLAEYRRGIFDACPDTHFFLSRFCKDVTLADILDARDP
ncbi:MAG: MBL fold metallo-hydrolase [bacterium]